MRAAAAFPNERYSTEQTHKLANDWYCTLPACKKRKGIVPAIARWQRTVRIYASALLPYLPEHVFQRGDVGFDAVSF